MSQLYGQFLKSEVIYKIGGNRYISKSFRTKCALVEFLFGM